MSTTMTGSDQQRRHPGGQPTGGRFAEETKPGAGVALSELSDAEYNAEGTFAYPPRPRSAAQHIAFWTTVPIPDDVLQRVHKAFEHARENRLAEETKKRHDVWKGDHPDPSGKAFSARKNAENVARWEDKAKAEWDRLRGNLEAEWPSMPVFEIRDVVRCHHMIEDAGQHLPKDEATQVARHQIEFQGEMRSVRSIYDTYRTWVIRRVLRPDYGWEA